MNEDLIDKRQAIWRSRRGMLELDLYLTPFVESLFDELTPRTKLRYRELLQCEDVEIVGWLNRDSKVPERFESIVEMIVAFANRDKELT